MIFFDGTTSELLNEALAWIDANGFMVMITAPLIIAVTAFALSRFVRAFNGGYE